MAPPKPHFLLVPYTEQGHINPMLSLASQLASLGCTITFVKADHKTTLPINGDDVLQAHHLQLPACAHRLRFVSLSPAPISDHPSMTRHEVLRKTLAGMGERQALLEKLIAESKATPDPISCVVCDIMVWKWVKDVAKKEAIIGTLLVPNSATSLYVLHLMSKGKGMEMAKLFGRIATARRDDEGVRRQKTGFFRSLFEGIEDASHILVNSFERLEASVLESLEPADRGLTFQYIGPLFPTWSNDAVSVGSKMARQAGSLYMEDESCLLWLEQQQRCSVLFVSFGSEGMMEAEDLEELAMGVEASGYKFLWVVRPDAPTSSKPAMDFQERNEAEGKGMFISWAPQKRVLQEPAIGGFLTHGGWNSTMEAVSYGVPMLCFPLLGDQPINAGLVQNEWGVGINLARQSAAGDGSMRVSRAEVTKAVQALMEDQHSLLRKKVGELKQAAQDAISISYKVLASFVEDIANPEQAVQRSAHLLVF